LDITGYIMITFWILWKGNNLYVMNPLSNSFKSTLAKWKTLLSYTIFTMFCKVALQLVGCVFAEWFFDGNGVNKSMRCTVRQLFSVACVNSVVQARKDEGAGPLFPHVCSVVPHEAQIGFDAIALAFLVFQIRIFHTWFFQHCMVEYRSEIILANRGAVLKNQLIEKEMKEQNEQQTAKFNEIRKRTQMIRERYNKQMEKGVRIFEPQTYAHAKRAGDYYMFDYDPNTDELVKPVESFVPEVTPGATRFEKLDPGQLVYAATGHDLNLARTLEQVKEAEKLKENEERMIQAMKDDDDEDEVCHKMSLAINAMDMVSAWLNRLSREHRYVAYVLSKEKVKLKEGHSDELSNTSQRLTDLRQRMNISGLLLVQSEGDIQKMESAALNDWQQRSVLARFMNALGSCIAANTDLICYFLAVMAHASGAGVITLPLPLMVFFWGTLSNPRPSKFFWVSMIAYTEFVIVTKFVCQFTIFDFNSISTQSKQVQFLDFRFRPFKLFFLAMIQRQSNFAAFDVPLLFALFFHRYMLRKLGLWKDANLTVTFQNLQQPNEDGQEVYVFSSDEKRAEAGSDAEQQSPKLAPRAAATVADPEVGRNPVARFIMQLFKPKFRYIRDLYPIMFGLDVVAFIIIAFGYSAFGEGGSGNVIGDIQSSRIPLTFVVMLVVMTLMIVIDRGLYLRKWVYGKLAYQLVIIIFLHIWIFFILPHLTRRAAAENTVAKALYVIKCLYLLVSAWQIRNGYPQLCIGNLLTHAYGLANMIFFKVFMLVPFLFELRTAIDWTWTDTSMPLFDFFNMENFYAVIYNLKCARTFEQSYPAPRGLPKGVIVKYLMGLPMILLIVFLVWSPLLAFSLMNRIGRWLLSFSGLINAESFSLYLSFNDITRDCSGMSPFTDYLRYFPSTNGTDSMKRSRDSVSFLKEYTTSDILVISLHTYLFSGHALFSCDSLIHFIVAVEFTRPYDEKKKQAATHSTQWTLALDFECALQKISFKHISLPEAFPSYMLVPNEGAVNLPTPIVATIVYNQDNYQRPDNASYKDWFDTLRLSLPCQGSRQNCSTTQHPPQYTNVYFNASNITYGVHRDRTYVQTIAFVDKAFPSFFAKYLQGGVIAMYISLVIVVGRLIRTLFANSPTDVMVTEIPNPDFLLKICLDIYLVREAKDFCLEQDLFAKLIFLFRSPATLIQWTRHKPKRE
uniref:ANK_REP_REGION domain-containing protein n=1 Tax=Angiostrongylus cantonensis TaxID=6313 RepID=A0A158P6T1_ANGCA